MIVLDDSVMTANKQFSQFRERMLLPEMYILLFDANPVFTIK